MEIINIDTCDLSELDVLIQYGSYAALKKSSMHLRNTGNIDEALKIESQMEKIYNDIPSDYKW